MPAATGMSGANPAVQPLIFALVLASCALMLAGTAEARHWRRGWPVSYPGWGYYGWGYPAWAFPPGGFYGPSAVWYVPPRPPEPPVVLPRRHCPAGRVPARWIKVKKDGRTVYEHVMSRCR